MKPIGNVVPLYCKAFAENRAARRKRLEMNSARALARLVVGTSSARIREGLVYFSAEGLRVGTRPFLFRRQHTMKNYIKPSLKQLGLLRAVTKFSYHGEGPGNPIVF
jgi:hypothetical protein